MATTGHSTSGTKPQAQEEVGRWTTWGTNRWIAAVFPLLWWIYLVYLVVMGNFESECQN